MKHLAIPALAAFLMVADATGGPISVSNVKGFDTTPVVDSAGFTVTGSDPVIVAVGTFASEPDTLLSGPDLGLSGGLYATLLAEFTPYGPQAAMVDPVAPLNWLGVFRHQHDEVVAASALAGKPVYVIVAKGGDLAGATEVCILKTGAVFDPAEDENPLPRRVGVGTSFGTVVIAGSTAVHTASATNLDPTQNAAYTMASITSGQEIAVESPPGTDLTTGSASFDFGEVLHGAGGVVRSVVVRNVGTSALSGLSISVEGTDAGDFPFDATSLPASLEAEGSGGFDIAFTPNGASSGTRTAVLRIHSDDADEDPFEISLTGIGFAPGADADGDGLDDWAEFRLGGLGFDWQLAQPAMVTALNDGVNAAGLYRLDQIRTLHTGVPLIERDAASGRVTLTMDWKESADLIQFTDFPAQPPEVSVNGEGDIEFEFEPSGDAAFFRIEAD